MIKLNVNRNIIYTILFLYSSGKHSIKSKRCTLMSMAVTLCHTCQISCLSYIKMLNWPQDHWVTHPSTIESNMAHGVILVGSFLVLFSIAEYVPGKRGVFREIFILKIHLQSTTLEIHGRLFCLSI